VDVFGLHLGKSDASGFSLFGDKAQYIKNKGLNDAFYKNMIVQYLTQYGSASREDIHSLLIDKISHTLDKKQKEVKIKNLLYSISRRDNRIKNIGTNRKARWIRVNEAK
jgi:ATP-dependent DNA helicase RecG